MSHHARERLGRASWIFLLCLTLVSSSSSSHRSKTPDVSTLKIEAQDSEASITLGKDLVLGPVSSEAATSASNGSVDLIIASDPGEVHRVHLPRQSAAVSRGAHVNAGSRYRAGKNPPKAADSYLEALKHSRTSDDPREGIVRVAEPKTKGAANRREYVHRPAYKPETAYGAKSPRIIAYGGGLDGASSSSPDSFDLQSFKPSMGYDDRYGAPHNHYGPPQNPYGPMQDDISLYRRPSHGSAGNSYLPPQQGPAVQTSVPIYGEPYALPDVSHVSILPSIDLGLPFALKLNAFTIAKIILKLVIFKMIVKFIAVICLLLFIPKLEIIKKKVSNKGEDDEEERSLSSSPYTSSTALNDLESTVRSSVVKYEVENDGRSNTTEKCTTPACRITQALTFDESWSDYLSLFESYVDEEESGRSAKRRDQ